MSTKLTPNFTSPTKLLLSFPDWPPPYFWFTIRFLRSLSTVAKTELYLPIQFGWPTPSYFSPVFGFCVVWYDIKFACGSSTTQRTHTSARFRTGLLYKNWHVAKGWNNYDPVDFFVLFKYITWISYHLALCHKFKRNMLNRLNTLLHGVLHL